jgi:hypothetical protein
MFPFLENFGGYGDFPHMSTWQGDPLFNAPMLLVGSYGNPTMSIHDISISLRKRVVIETARCATAYSDLISVKKRNWWQGEGEFNYKFVDFVVSGAGDRTGRTNIPNATQASITRRMSYSLPTVDLLPVQPP